jgi:hypothetical protein
MSPDVIAQYAGLFVPGFLSMKLFYMFGAQRQRLEWEWVAWSVALSLPIAAFADWVAPTLVPRPFAAEATANPVVRAGLAVAFGLSSAFLWRLVRRSALSPLRQIRMALSDSLWDLVISDALANRRWLCVAVDEGSDEQIYMGWPTMAYVEEANAEPWLYLTNVLEPVRERAGADKNWEPNGMHGLLVHRDHVRRLWIVPGDERQLTWRERLWPSRTAPVRATMASEPKPELARSTEGTPGQG